MNCQDGRGGRVPERAREQEGGTEEVRGRAGGKGTCTLDLDKCDLVRLFVVPAAESAQSTPLSLPSDRTVCDQPA
eukprot:3935460-Rhodomonas_salina.2